MSVQMQIGSFKSTADKERQLKYYKDQLKEQTNVNNSFEEAMIEKSRNKKYGIEAVSPMPKTETEMIKMKQDQIDIFLRLSKNVLDEDQAKKYATTTDPNLLKNINASWATIEKGIGNQKMTADAFNQYVIKILTDPTNPLSKLQYAYPSSFMTGNVQRIGEGEAQVVAPILETLNLEGSTLDQYRQSLRNYLKTTYPKVWGELDVMSKRDERKLINFYVNANVIEPTKSLKKGDYIAILKYEVAKKAPQKISRAQPYERRIKPSFRIIRTSTGGRVMFGRGVDTENKAKYAVFGKYFIHVPSLKRNFLNVKYKSLARVQTLPKMLISEELSTFIFDLIEKGKIDHSLFTDLSTHDQHLFYNLVRKANADLGLGNIKTTDEKKDLDDFLLLRGEIMAGNNNVDLLRKLKAYILRFMAEEKLSKNEGWGLLSEIAILV